MNTLLKRFFAPFLFLFGIVLSAFATAPAEVSATIDDMESTWTLIKGVIVAIGAFLILWRLLKKGTGKA